MVKAVISGYYGYKNFGDELISDVLIKHLNALEIDITVLSGNVDYTKSKNNVYAVNRFDIRKIVGEIKSCDFLISGGGSLLQDVTSLKSLVYYLFIIAIAILFNKKVIIFAQGIGPINNKFAKLITKNLLKLCGYISVRDENSLNLLKSWGIKADLVCDPVFSLEADCTKKTNSVGIQLRDFKTMNYNLLQKLAQLAAYKFSDRKIEIFSLQESFDLEISKKFENILKTINPEIKTEIVTDNIAERISQLEYMIGMRFHALLVAIKSGVKTCAINYDIKVEKLAQSVKIPIISLNGEESFEKIYYELENLKSEELLRFSENNMFDWSGFDGYISA
ncbi:polysaccharide pyruvyl transferase CsaB [bacterium]|nr:polysaccharide pyruvyl transferase CsaB [bacterium]